MPTIKQIAAIAGVSRGTVDRVLNNRGRVNPETEQRIREVLYLLNYSPNKAGKTLAIIKKNLKFGYILFSSGEVNPFWKDVEDGIHKKAAELAEYGVTVDIRYSSLNDWQDQVQLLEAFRQEGYNGIAITPLDSPQVAEKMAELSECGIPIVAVNSDVHTSGKIAYVGSNYYHDGRTAAGLLNLICGGKATVGIVSGSSDVRCHVERIRGFSEHIAEQYPGLTIAGTVLNHDDDIESYIQTRQLLEQNPDINALFLAAAGIQGACKAAMETAKRPVILSFDCIPATQRLIKEGVIAATIDQQPNYQGSKSLEILFNYISTGEMPRQAYCFTEASILIRESFS